MKKFLFLFTFYFIFANIYAQIVKLPTRGNGNIEGIRVVGNLGRSINTKTHLNKNKEENQPIIKAINHNNLIQLGEFGTILLDIKSDDNYSYLHTSGYTKDIKNIWQNDNKISSDYDLIGDQTDSNFHYTMFNQIYPKNKLLLIKTKIKTGTQQVINSTLPENLKIFTFKVVDENCFIACSYKKLPVIVVFNAKDNTYKILPNLIDRKAAFLSLYADYESFIVVLKEQKGGDLIIKKYSQDGYQLNSFVISNNGKKFNEAKICKLIDKLIIVGTYRKGISYKVKGLYSASLDNNFTIEKVNYTAFSQFEGLKNKKGKIAQFGIIHNLKPTENGVMCVFDFFDATISNQEYFGKIKFNYSMLCNLDTNANFKWNSIISLDGLTNFIYTRRQRVQSTNFMNILETNVKPAMQFLVNNNRIMGAFQHENAIYTNLFNLTNGELVAKATYEMEGGNEITGFLPWYNDNFLILSNDKSKLFSNPTLNLHKMKIVEQ